MPVGAGDEVEGGWTVPGGRFVAGVLVFGRPLSAAQLGPVKDNSKKATKEKPMGKRQLIFFLPPLVTKVFPWAQKVHQMVVRKRNALRKSGAVSIEFRKIIYCFTKLSICCCVSVKTCKVIAMAFDRTGTIRSFCTRGRAAIFRPGHGKAR